MYISIGSQSIITVWKLNKVMFIYIRTLSEIILPGVLQTVKKSYPRKRNIFFTEEFF